MNLLSLFGIDVHLNKLRSVAREGALALEDRFQLAQMEWVEEKYRLKLLLTFVLMLLGLTVVALTIASLAIVVQFWDSPDRVKAAWIVTATWFSLWAGLLLGILYLLRRGTVAFGPIREELGKDWVELQSEIFSEGRKSSQDRVREARPVDKDALLARITRQRERLARQQLAAANPPAVQNASSSKFPGGSAVSSGLSNDPDFPRSTTMRTLREHPLASVAVVGVAAAAITAMGPRRAGRVARWVIPLLLPRR